MIRASLAALAAILATLAAGAVHAAPQACFWVRDANGFKAVDERTVYVRARFRDVYELKLFAACPDVAWTFAIALRTPFSSQICEGSLNTADVIVRAGAGPRRCPIASVHKLTPAEVAALPPRDRP